MNIIISERFLMLLLLMLLLLRIMNVYQWISPTDGKVLPGPPLYKHLAGRGEVMLCLVSFFPSGIQTWQARKSCIHGGCNGKNHLSMLDFPANHVSVGASPWICPVTGAVEGPRWSSENQCPGFVWLPCVGQKKLESWRVYPLVNIQKTMENHHFKWENSL